MIEPTGNNIVVKATIVQQVSEGGIILDSDTVKKEQTVERTGIVMAIGPCAYVGWAGCDVEGKTPAECWGIKVGDKVEHSRYDGMDSVVSTDEVIYRYVPDTLINGVIS